MFTLYTIPGCMSCQGAINLMETRKIKYKNIILKTEKRKTAIKEKHKHATFPQVFYKKNFIGGFENLELIVEQCDKLNNLLDNAFNHIPTKKLDLFLNMCCELSDKKNACRIKAICSK